MAGKGKEVVYELDSEDEDSSEAEYEFEDCVEENNTKEDYDNGKVLFVDHIPETSTKDEIQSVFQRYGNARVTMYNTEECHGCCSVTYANSGEATAAISALHGRHTMLGGHQPIIVVLQKKRAAEASLKECFSKLKKFTMDVNPDLDVHIVDDQEKFCKSMTTVMGGGGADSLFSLMKQVESDRCAGEHQSSPLNAIERGSISVGITTNYIMKPLDGKKFRKNRKKAQAGE